MCFVILPSLFSIVSNQPCRNIAGGLIFFVCGVTFVETFDCGNQMFDFGLWGIIGLI